MSLDGPIPRTESELIYVWFVLASWICARLASIYAYSASETLIILYMTIYPGLKEPGMNIW